MAMAKKQRDRKELDAEIKNSLTTGIGEFELFFMEHWRALTAAGLAIVLAIGIVYGVRGWMRSCQLEAQDALAAAQTVEALQKALAKYGTDPSAAFARIRLARLCMQENKLKEAEVQYKVLETSGLPPEMLIRVKIDRGYLTEKSGDLKGAAEILALVAANASAPAGLRAEAEFGAGRLYAALKNNDLAKKHLDACVRLQGQAGIAGQQWVTFAQFLQREAK